MATITLPRGTAAAGGAGSAALHGRINKTLVTIVDLVNAAAEGGVTLAYGDVIQAVALPANSIINKVYCRVIEVADVASFNVNVGIAGGNEYVDNKSILALGLLTPTRAAQGNPEAISQAATGTIATANVGTFNYTATYDTIDVSIATFSGTVPTTGQIAVFVDFTDLTTPGGANIADVS